MDAPSRTLIAWTISGSVTAILLCLLVTKGVGSYLAANYPNSQFAWIASGGREEITLADRELARALDKARQTSDTSQARKSQESPVAESTPGLPEIAFDDDTRMKVRHWAEDALRQEPLRVRALEILGLASSGQLQAQFMNAAAERSYRTRFATLWKLNQMFHARNFVGAGAAADALFRANPDASALVVPLLAEMSEDPEGQKVVMDLLKEEPPWRATFFSSLDGHVKDARTPLNLLISLNGSAHPPTKQEIGAYLSLLIQHRFYDLAYYSWLQFLPVAELARAAFLYNGDFASKPSGLPFDWVIESGEGVFVEIAPRDDDSLKNALLVSFGGGGRVEFPTVRELLVLLPGTYSLSGWIKGDVNGPRGLVWRLDCYDSNSPIARTDMLLGAFRAWTPFFQSFSVPERCGAQVISLSLDARSTSETFVSGAVSFRDLKIEAHSG